MSRLRYTTQNLLPGLALDSIGLDLYLNKILAVTNVAYSPCEMWQFKCLI
ncbi:hypothetical protein RvY_19005 [Ramazzottius varieornatus]|uniref:Uncharacterized protein n=1 Tax=Ramazzottius varieornatus TaxID=947166 RepID=A0A1D1W964_RAMVA|nr:hypothetical protein RvY_19005 [Ramazzottius varieornatus]